MARGYNVIKANRGYIQILHTGQLHWICIANTNAKRKDNSNCFLYDSLNNGNVTSAVVSQIASLSYVKSTVISVNIEKVQQQVNSVDCGVFAIAFATSLAFGDDPTKLSYDDTQLRPHLLKCLKENNFKRFPTILKSSSLRCRKKVKEIEVYCSCRMPWNSDINSDDESQDMAYCTLCKEWYHRVCEKIPSNVFDNNRIKWKCSSCI